MSGIAPTRALNSGHRIPLLGLGTWPMDDAEATTAVAGAIRLGYRLIDTAAKYGNEVGVGRGLRDGGVPREELFVTTKLRGSEQGAGTRDALLASLDRLGLDYVDLYLVHWPLPRLDRYLESYEAMLALAEEGLIRSVGVSNFTEAHIRRLRDATGVLPAVDQIELSPTVTRPALRRYLDGAGIVAEAWSPLGRSTILDRPAVTALAEKHGRTPAQVVLRWHIQQGVVAIPKSGDLRRQADNLRVFDVELTDAEMDELSGLDGGEGAGVDPDRHEEF